MKAGAVTAAPSARTGEAMKNKNDCEECNRYRDALHKIAQPISIPFADTEERDRMLSYVTMKVRIAIEALYNDDDR